MLINMS